MDNNPQENADELSKQNLEKQKKKFEHYKKLADQGNAVGQFNVGVCYDRGEGVVQDYKKAFKYYKKSADKGNIGAQFNVACCYDRGEGVAKDKEKAFEYYKKSADQGNAKAQFNLGIYYDRGEGVAKDKEKAFEYYKKSADQGDANAQFNVAYCYDKGEGVAEDKEKAFEYYEKSADQGNAKAQNNLAWCYDNGEGVAEDKEKAFEYYDKSAKQESGYALYNLGVYYDRGEGVAQDKEKAFDYYKKSADRGNVYAQYNVAWCYDNKKDYKKAFRYYKKAATQGKTDALYNIGDCYYYAEGVNKDYKKALRYYKKAAAQGNIRAKFYIGYSDYKSDLEKEGLASIKETLNKGCIKSEIFLSIYSILGGDKEKIILIAEPIIALYRQIRKYFDKCQEDSIDKLYHFRGIAELKNMLKKKEQNEEQKGEQNEETAPPECANNVLWVLDSIGMNDPREGRILLSDNNTGNEYKKFREELEFFYKKDNKLLAPENEDIHCFLTSFTEEKDSLALWLAYGDSGKGFSIEVDPKQFPRTKLDNIMHRCIYPKTKENSQNDAIQDENFSNNGDSPDVIPFLHKVKYFGKETKLGALDIDGIVKEIENVKEKIEKESLNEEQKSEIKGLVRSILAAWMFTFKDESYKSEKEWRLIYHIPRNSPFYRDNVKVQYEHIMPSRLYIKTKDILFKTVNKSRKNLVITIGPKVEQAYLMKHHIEYLLVQNGYDKVDVECSDVRYR